MREILWFRRDLRVKDNAILANAKDEVLPIFIFDKNILEKLKKDDKRVTFIYKSVLKLKYELKALGLDLAIFYDKPINVFKKLRKYDFDRVLCSVDFTEYSKKRDKEIEQIVPMERFLDSFLIDPALHLKSNNLPYKVFTPFYKSLAPIYESNSIAEYRINSNLKLINYDYSFIPKLDFLGFEKCNLPLFLEKDSNELLEEFISKIDSYKKDRDYFYKDASSKLSVHLRFGLISPKQIFNKIKKYSYDSENRDFFIRELFWREFYNYILYHFPNSEFENFNGYKIPWRNDIKDYEKWCKGETGIPIIDAGMRYLNQTGLMHNRLRMIVASFLTKNLLIDWRWGEKYFAEKLLDYEASSNIGSWQWAASTGADAVPYFRIFNPYTQSLKFDKNADFIKDVLTELKDIDAKLLHKENALKSNIDNLIITIKESRIRALNLFKNLKEEK